MPAVAQRKRFRPLCRSGVTYVNINGEIIKTLLPDMSNISIKSQHTGQTTRTPPVHRQRLAAMHQGRKVQTTHQNEDSDEKVCILRKKNPLAAQAHF